MDQHNIDRLFREKLDGNEVAPSAKAWSEVERQIGGKKSSSVYWIAASVALVLTTWVAWPEQNPVTGGIASYEINHPVQVVKSAFDAPIAASLSTKPAAISQVIQQMPQIDVQKSVMVALEEVQKEEPIRVDEMIEESQATEMAVAVEENIEPSEEVIDSKIEVIEDLAPEFSAIKITYIASNTTEIENSEVQSDSTGVLKKFIAFTEKIDPGEMLADIKTAKDNLLRGGLKNKKDRTVMTP